MKDAIMRRSEVFWFAFILATLTTIAVLQNTFHPPTDIEIEWRDP